MTDSFVPTQTGFGRIFIIEDEARADRDAVYHSCMRLDALEQAYGDSEKIECPDPNNANQFIEVGEIQGAEERPTSSLIGRYPAKEASVLKRIADRRCTSDVQMNIGICNDVSLFNTFDKKLILEAARITNYATEALGALSSDERAAVNETGDISIKLWYEVLALGFARRADSIITNEVIDVVICDQISCGACEDSSDGCQKIFAITLAAGGSPGTPADVVYSLDGGATWNADDIDTLDAAEDPTGVACVSGYLVVVSNDSNSLHYADLDDFDGVTDPTFTEVATGFVATGEPNDIWSNGNTAFVVGDSGYVYILTDPTAGVTVIDAGVAVADDLQAVHAITDEFMVAVGNAGSIVKTENGATVAEVTPSPVGVGVNFTSIWIKSNNSDEWFIGGNDGNYYYTVNNGVTFTAGTFAGSGSGTVQDIAFATKSVGYLSHTTTAPLGRIFRTYDGGSTWNLLPESGTLPAGDRFTAIAACEEDANFIVAVGLHDDAADGIIVVGED